MTTFEILQAPFSETAWGYTADAKYERVWLGEIDPGDTIGATLEKIWVGFQRVDPDYGPWPPEGYTGRSLSIGDVIVLDGDAWTPDHVGFKPVEDFRGSPPHPDIRRPEPGWRYPLPTDAEAQADGYVDAAEVAEIREQLMGRFR